jgi:hypothetical protein
MVAIGITTLLLGSAACGGIEPEEGEMPTTEVQKVKQGVMAAPVFALDRCQSNCVHICRSYSGSEGAEWETCIDTCLAFFCWI